MFAVHELGFLATRVDVAICANVMDFCVRRQPTTSFVQQGLVRYVFRPGHEAWSIANVLSVTLL